MSIPTETADFASLCTLGCGPGQIEVVEVASLGALQRALRELPSSSLVLGGGSNVVPPARAPEEPVLRLIDGGEPIHVADDGEVEVFAGVRWDRLAEAAVLQGWSGIECLSGIPGSVGAAPIQNIGAYGQSLEDTLLEVTLIERRGPADTKRVPAEDLALRYRHSALKDEGPGRRVVAQVRLKLRSGLNVSRPSHPGLDARLGDTPTLLEIRAAVLAERTSKGMVLDADDPDTRGVGSFFVNPIVSAAEWEGLQLRLGSMAASCPAHDFQGGVKLSAAWLIDQAGFTKGFRFDDIPGVGLSTKHCLAITNRGGASTEGVRRFAGRIQDGVEERWGIRLTPEARFLD